MKLGPHRGRQEEWRFLSLANLHFPWAPVFGFSSIVPGWSWRRSGLLTLRDILCRKKRYQMLTSHGQIVASTFNIQDKKLYLLIAQLCRHLLEVNQANGKTGTYFFVNRNLWLKKCLIHSGLICILSQWLAVPWKINTPATKSLNTHLFGLASTHL